MKPQSYLIARLMNRRTIVLLSLLAVLTLAGAAASRRALSRETTFDAPTQPTDADVANNTVVEGATSGTPVGITANSTDSDSNPVTYSLTDDAGGRFAIDGSTGVVTVANQSLIDYESATGHAYTITAKATDNVTTSDSPTQDFTINVTNVAPSQPSDSDPTANTVAEGAANGTTVGLTVSSTDPNGGTLTYSLTNNAGGRFMIDSLTGVVTVANGAAIDYESASGHAYTITAKANDGTADSSTQDFTIAVTDVNEVPVLTNLGPNPSSTEQVFALLDNDVTVSDPELDSFNGGSGDYAGAFITIARSGGANADDAFSFDTSGALFTVSANNLQAGGQTFATFTSTGGTLTINFTSSGTPATTALVSNVLQHVTYANQNDNPPASVTLDYTVNDGNTGGAQGSGGALTGTGSITVNITPVNDNPTLTTNAGLSVNPGASGTIDSAKLLVSDPDNTATQLVFTVGTATAHGTLKKGVAPLTANSTFTQDDINNSLITYQASGDGANADSFTFTVSDGAGGTIGTTTFNITITCTTNPVVTSSNDSGSGSLRNAILVACSNSTITFDMAQVTSPITLTTGELVINKDLTINGPTTTGLTISGNLASRIFNVGIGKTFAISNLTIDRGRAASGGGILNGGTLTITNSTISNNQTINGTDATGAANGGNSLDGGGIYSAGTLTLINSTFSGNKTGRGGNASGTGNGGNSGNGGGVYNTGTMKLTNCTVANNQTGQPGQPTGSNNSGTIGTVGLGGGIFNSGGTLTLNNTIVATNADGFLDPDDINGTATSSNFNLIGSDAGLNGISNGSNGNQVGTVAVPLSPHLGALADNGGPTKTHLPDQFSTAIDAGSNGLALDQDNITPLANDQRGAGFPRKINGGKAKPDEPTVDIGAVEVAVVAAPPGADLTVTKSADRDTVVPDRDLTYTIVATNNGADPATNAGLTDQLPQVTNNTDPDNPTFIGTTFVSFAAPAGWSCSAPPFGSTGTFSCTKSSDFAGVSQQTFTLVVHVPPTAMPNSGAPFISNSVTVSADNETNTENNGGFANTQLLSCITNPIVTKNTDSGPGTLRQAIADACVGSTITFDMTPGHVVSPITLTTGELLINKNLTITGPGANLLTVRRSGAAANFRIFEIASGSITVNIDGMTISNGKAFGGGILNNTGATLNLKNLAVSGNQTGAGGNGSPGGGIYNAGTLTLVNSTISGNQTGAGGNGSPGGGGRGGFGGGVYSIGTLTIVNSTISGNQTGAGGNGSPGGSGGSGGGVYNDTGTLTLVNSTISGNQTGAGGSGSPGGFGGGVQNNSGNTANVKNTIIAGNSVASGGQGPDFFGNLTSQDYNLIGNTSGATITGMTTHNIINQSANLGALANNGGPTQTMLPLQNSPAINAGDAGASLPPDTFDLDGDSNTAEALPVDQRGFARVVGGNFDIGAVETNYMVAATAGTPQSATITSAFATALKATVTESGIPQNLVSVTFTAPASGASGAFPGPSTTAVASTNSSGVATAPTFTANGTAGSYNVVAGIGAGLPTATFALTNNRINQTITFGALANKNFGDPDFNVSATATSGLAVSFTASGSCTVTGATVHITSAGSCTITAKQAGDSNYNAAADVPQSFNIANRSLVSFSQSNYNVNESTGFVTITVSRAGDLSVPVSVDYATDDTGAPVPCSTLNSGLASSRCDFTAMFGTLKFAANDSQKTFVIPITQDSYTEGPEMFTVNLSNLTGTGAAFATPSSAMVTISDSAAPAPNAIDDTTTFVRMQYHDFLNREPDAAGLAFWKNNIDKCNDPANRAPGQTLAQCIEVMRINTSAAFFLSIEFLSTGNLVRGFYVVALNRPATNNMPAFVEFERDTQAMQRGVIVDPNNNAWQTVLSNNRDAFMKDFVTRAEFVGLYPTTDAPTQYVDKLYLHANVTPATPAERQAAIDEFAGAGTAADPGARGRALLRITQNTAFQQREMNRSFVQMQYFGYLRRNPNDAPDTDFTGYNFWVAKLNQFNGNFIQAEMVKAFISSAEYRRRFGP